MKNFLAALFLGLFCIASYASSLVQSKYPLTSLYTTALVGEQFNESIKRGLGVGEYVSAGFWPRVFASHQRAISGQYYAYVKRNPRSTERDTLSALGITQMRERPKQEFYVPDSPYRREVRPRQTPNKSERCAPVLNTSCTVNFKASRDRYDIELRRYQSLLESASSAAAKAQAKIALDLAQAQLNQATRAYQTCLQTQGGRAGSAELQNSCVQTGVDNGFSESPGSIRFDEEAYRSHLILVKRSRAIRMLIDEFNSSRLSDLEFLQILELTTNSLIICERYIDSLSKDTQNRIDPARSRKLGYQPFVAAPYSLDSAPLCQVIVSSGTVDITKDKRSQIDALEFFISRL